MDEKKPAAPFEHYESEILEITPMPEMSRLFFEGAPKTHELKCWPSSFEFMKKQTKLFEYRKADRDFMIGDTLHLREWAPVPMRYTGRELKATILYILRGPKFDVPEGYCIMSLAFEEDEQEQDGNENRMV